MRQKKERRRKRRKRRELRRRKALITVLRLPLHTPRMETDEDDLGQEILPEEVTILPYKAGYFKRKRGTII